MAHRRWPSRQLQRIKVALRFRPAIRIVKRIAGMPDYEAFLAHMRTRHPDCRLPSEREFFESYLKQKYAGGGSRCC